MATTRTSLITLGLSQIEVGDASKAGTMPSSMGKIGKTYKDTCKMAQANAEVTEHFEEGKSAPEVRSKQKKVPTFQFSIMDANVEDLVAYVGGSKVGTGSNQWGFDGDELVANRAIRIVTAQGLNFEIPNADIECVINADFSAKGIMLLDFIVTPMAVDAGKALRGVPKASV